MCTWNKIKGVNPLGRPSVTWLDIPPRGKIQTVFFGARWLSIKYFPRKLRILVSVNAFPLSWQINSAAKKFNLFLHQIVVNDDVIVIFFLLLFLSIVVHVLCPQNTACNCMQITYKTFQEREERKIEWKCEQERYCIYTWMFDMQINYNL